MPSTVYLHNQATHRVFEKQAVERIFPQWAIKRTGPQHHHRQAILAPAAQRHLLGDQLAPLIGIHWARRIILIHHPTGVWSAQHSNRRDVNKALDRQTFNRAKQQRRALHIIVQKGGFIPPHAEYAARMDDVAAALQRFHIRFWFGQITGNDFNGWVVLEPEVFVWLTSQNTEVISGSAQGRNKVAAQKACTSGYKNHRLVDTFSGAQLSRPAGAGSSACTLI